MDSFRERHFRFGVFQANPNSGELWKSNRRIALQDQPFRILVLLLQRAGELVSREELKNALWPSANYGDFDEGVNTAVMKLRQALGDSASNPRFIETMPRKGYRFIAPIATTESPVDSGLSGSRLEGPYLLLRSGALLAGLGAIAVLAAGAAWLVYSRSHQITAASPVPFTSYSGREIQPSFSPDGNHVAFAWNGEAQSNFDIYVKQIGEEQSLRLTTDPAKDFGPAWSPDGRSIAFGRLLTPTKAGVFVIPAIGGPERKLTETEAPHERKPEPFLAWSSDSRWLVISETADAQRSLGSLAKPGGTPASLFLLSVETGERRRLTYPPRESIFDAGPGFSPDGRALAFIRASSWSVTDLFLLKLNRDLQATGEPVRLTSWNRATSSPTWTIDGREIVVASGRWDASSLWRVGVSRTLLPRRLEFAGDGADSPAIGRPGRLVYSQTSVDVNIWRVDLSGGDDTTRTPKRFIASTRTDMFPQFSPDGSRLLFLSDRTGRVEIWTASSDGTNQRQVTSMNAPIVGAPRWSPDGERIVFDSNLGGRWEVYVVDPAVGAPRQLTDHPADDCCASWSRDGRSIYFMSSRSGQPQIWKMPAAGGPAVQITRHGGHVALESPDGRFLYYSIRAGDGERNGIGGLWRVPVNGGDEVQVLPSVTFYNFVLCDDGIYFIPRGNSEVASAVYFYPFTGGEPRPLFPVGEVTPGLSISPDGRFLMYCQIDERRSDLMLVNDFR
jgi:Tol biopolymer transport system component/DNA-binding winged helix-turn-helix (wHTH) protein